MNGHLGTSLTSRYLPNTLLSHPPSPRDITLPLLLANQTHLGHCTSLWNPSNQSYIYGIREGIHIISLETTAAYLRRACRIVTSVTSRGGIVLFVGSRPNFDRVVVRAAELAGGYHLFERWTPGTITNAQQILGRCKLKVVDAFDQERPEYERLVMDQAAVKPDLVVCLNPLENYVMLHECSQENIPTVGVVDTDCDPTWVTYPIPANDDSLRSIQLIAGVLGRAGQEGQAWRLSEVAEGRATSLSSPTLMSLSEARHASLGVTSVEQDRELLALVYDGEVEDDEPGEEGETEEEEEEEEEEEGEKRGEEV